MPREPLQKENVGTFMFYNNGPNHVQIPDRCQNITSQNITSQDKI